MICVQTLKIQCFFICPSFCSYYSVFGFFISLFVVVMARQRMRVRFCTRKVPGRWSPGRYTPFLMIAAMYRSRKKERTQDSRTTTKRKRKRQLLASKMVRVRHGLVFFPFPLPFLSFFLSLPLLFLFLLLSFFLFLFLSFFIFLSYSPIPFPFLFLSFSFCFSFLFLVPFPFPFLSLSYSFLSLPLLFLFLFLFPFLAHVNPLVKVFLASTWKNDKRKKKTTTCEKNIWKGSGLLQDPIKTHLHTHLRITQLFIGNIRQLGRNLETTHHWHKNWLSRCLLPNTDPSCDLGCDALRIGSQ